MDSTDTTAAVEATDLAKAMLAFVIKHPGCTLAQLVAGVAGCAGSLAYNSRYSNLILWNGVSAGALDALAWLERTRAIRFEATTVHPYGQAGRDMKMCRALQFEDCRFPRWLPVLLHANRLGMKDLRAA